jgi:hypothetical protein
MKLKNIFNPFTQKQVEIQFTQKCFVNSVEYAAGTKATFDERTAAELVAIDRAVDHAAQLKAVTKKQHLNLLIPAMPEPTAVPSAYKNLTKCFTDWHKLNQAGIILMNHRDEIERRLIAKISNRSLPTLRNMNDLSAQDQAKLISGVSFTPPPTEFELEEQRHLKNEFQKADQAVRDWKASNSDELIRYQLQCSDAAQDAHGSLRRDITALHNLAFQLFSLRINALGLGLRDVERLFQNSSDAAKYASIEKPHLQDLRLAWSEQGEDPKLYLDQPVPVMAQLIAAWSDTAAHVKSLTKAAMDELAKAQAVTKAA